MSELKPKKHPLTINGVIYSVSFNMSVIDMLQDSYGSLEEFLRVVQIEIPDENEDTVIVEVEEGAEPIELPKKLSDEEKRELLKQQKKAIENLIICLVNDAYEYGEFEVSEGSETPKQPMTVRTMHHLLLPLEQMTVNNQVIEIMNAAYESAIKESGGESEKN